MNIDTFWACIEAAKVPQSDNIEQDDDLFAERLKGVLTDYSPDDIAAFDAVLTHLLSVSEQDVLYAATACINRSGSYDGFFYFRHWLIGQGRTVFESTVRDPETLVSVVERDREYEWSSTAWAATSLYKAKTGREIDTAEIDTPQIPAVEMDARKIKWSWETVDEMFPILNAKLYPDDPGTESLIPNP